MRILIKFGTAIMTDNNKLNYRWLEEKVNEVSELLKKGDEIIIVASGAVAAGMEILKLEERPKDTLSLQELSGIGQIKLINTFAELFSKNKVNVAQVLLTHHNLSSQEEKNNLSQVINNYLKDNIIPIINENDVVSKEELMYNSTAKFTDNDLLAALVAKELKVNKLLLITDVEGLCDVDPKKNKCATVITQIKKITPEVEKMASTETNSLGRGGMYSKIMAARMVSKENITTIVGSGKYKIHELLDGSVLRTQFS